MAQRAGWFAIALLGVLLIAGLALLGRDIHRLARAGPKWRRRLVGAGLALLSIFGVPACGETKDTSPGPASAGDRKGLCCYMMVATIREQFDNTMQFMLERLTLLDQFLESKKLDAQVVQDAVQSIEEQLPILFKRPDYGGLSESERCRADSLRVEIEAKIADLKTRLAKVKSPPKR